MTKTSLIAAESAKLWIAAAFLTFSTVCLAAPNVAAAQGTGGSADTTYDFEDDLVQGDLVRPDGEMLNVRRRHSRGSLIRVREHFVPEMLKSVENL